jgi:predicted metal-dependent phosphoesterase TrpH
MALSSSALHRVNADLHCHSRVSDGTLEPGDVARRAHEHNVTLWALTDHDELAGQAEAAAAARELGMQYVGGVEISVSWAHETVHVLGLGVDFRDLELTEGLARTRSTRDRRARDMSDQLETVGIMGSYEGALALAGNPQLISRTHFARFLVEGGHCTDIKDVFSRYLVAGKPGFVPMKWASLVDALEWILGAGGVAVVAHPGRYRFSSIEHDEFFGEFIERGGRGVEIISGSHTPDDFRVYADVARHYGLLGSRGSDFHSPSEGNAEFGSLPPLPDFVVPVWRDWL